MSTQPISIAITRLDNGTLINVRSLGGKTADRHDSGCLACGAGAYMQHKDDCRARGLQTRVEWRNRVSSLTHERFAAIVESLSGK